MDEFLALAHHVEHDLDCTIARLFNTVGPKQSGQYGMVIPTFVAHALRDETIEIHGDGDQTRCFCHVDDTVRALQGLMDDRSARARSTTSARRTGSRSAALAERVIELTGSSSTTVDIPYDEVYGHGIEDMLHRIPSTEKIKAATGWQPERSLEDILGDVIAFERASADAVETGPARERRVRPSGLAAVSRTPSPQVEEPWPGEQRRNPSATSATWVVRVRALALAPLRGGAAAARRARGVRILDVGCGVKPYLPFFAEHRERVRRTRRRRDPDRRRGRVRRGHARSPTARFDLVLCTQVLEHCDDPAQAVRELRRVTAPGGRVLASTHGVQVYHPSPHDYWRWTHEGLAQALREQCRVGSSRASPRRPGRHRRSAMLLGDLRRDRAAAGRCCPRSRAARSGR